MKQRVLIVDDTAPTRRILGRIIRDMGYEPIEAADATEAANYIRGGSVSLALIDLLLPGMNGLELCQWIRSYESSRHIPLIVCSACGERRHVEAALEAGANGYLSKPVERAAITAQVGRFLGAATVGAQN